MNPACLSEVISVGAVFDASVGDLTSCVNHASCFGTVAPGCPSRKACSHPSSFPDPVTDPKNNITTPRVDIGNIIKGNENCIDRTDNDGDRLIDCDDPDCIEDNGWQRHLWLRFKGS
ncbi:hypothetical protein ACFLU6_11925 [Acidobacteriota bacterium]